MSHFFVQGPKCGGLIICPQLQEVSLAAALTSSLHPVYDLGRRIPAREINLETLATLQAVLTKHNGTTFFLFLVINISLYHKISMQGSHLVHDTSKYLSRAESVHSRHVTFALYTLDRLAEWEHAEYRI
jgi:hypothetical protein